MTNNKLIIRTSNGDSYYKFWIRDYYDENGISGNITLIYDIIEEAEKQVNLQHK